MQFEGFHWLSHHELCAIIHVLQLWYVYCNISFVITRYSWEASCVYIMESF